MMTVTILRIMSSSEAYTANRLFLDRSHSFGTVVREVTLGLDTRDARDDIESIILWDGAGRPLIPILICGGFGPHFFTD